jgi:hypothetical protein
LRRPRLSNTEVVAPEEGEEGEEGEEEEEEEEDVICILLLYGSYAL